MLLDVNLSAYIKYVTRRAEFSILCYRVIRLQGKFDFSSMQLIGALKVKSSIFGDVPYVQISL